MRWLPLLLGLMLVGCSQPAVDAPTEELGRTARADASLAEVVFIPNLNVSAGESLHWQVDDWIGDVAFRLAVVSGGGCRADLSGTRTNDRGMGALVTTGEGWHGPFSSEPSAEAAGVGNDRPGTPMPVSAYGQVEEGGWTGLWLSDLGPTAGLGPALTFDLACDKDSAVSLEAARRVVLTGGQDFSSDAAATVPAAVDVVVNGRLSLAFDGPASLLYACASIAGSCTLEADGPEGVTSLTPDYRIQPLAPGEYTFTLDAVNAAFPLIFAIAEFRPVTAQDGLTALPVFD